MENITINKTAFMDMLRVKDQFDMIVESMEIMAGKVFMESYQKARKQVKERDFTGWNAYTSSQLLHVFFIAT